jgi:hypothetical protein
MFDKNNSNYKLYLAGLINEEQYYKSFDENINEISNDGNDMLKANLGGIIEHAQMMLDLLTPQDQTEEWMEYKVSVCKIYMQDVAHAFKHDKEEEMKQSSGCGGSSDFGGEELDANHDDLV